MENSGKWLFFVWAVLAIIAFVGAFFTSPIWVKIVGFAFGAYNAILIIFWLIATIQEKKEYQKQTKDFEKEGIPEKE